MRQLFVFFIVFLTLNVVHAEQPDESLSLLLQLSSSTELDGVNDKVIQLYQQANSLYVNTRLAQLQKAYEEAKANEQSLANRTLTALSVAAAGIGGMELAMGLAEQKADKDADANMDAYIETMRCSYGDGKSVKASSEEIELPGGNDAELMKLRSEYFALAADLKERKEALGMKPGIESEEILDKSQMGLYDDEFVGITGGAYESLYRAKMLNSEKDQAKIDEDAKASKNRVIAGAVVAGAGVVAGIAGNAIINKDSPKNNAKEIQSRRAQIKEEIDTYLKSEIDRCNELIDENQKLAFEIEKDNELMSNEDIKDYVTKVSKLQKLTDIKDISEIKEHPLCR